MNQGRSAETKDEDQGNRSLTHAHGILPALNAFNSFTVAPHGLPSEFFSNNAQYSAQHMMNHSIDQAWSQPSTPSAGVMKYDESDLDDMASTLPSENITDPSVNCPSFDLKGVAYEGMSGFDAGTSEQRRQRNQRKPDSVMARMERCIRQSFCNF